MIDYKCSNCGVDNCKLWRQYNTFLEHIELLCAICAMENQNVSYEIDDDGSHYDTELQKRTRTIEWLVPAIPTEENDTFWGYTSVPQDRIDWWYKLT